jgi:UDP-N-acetylglucosamine 2-epimerase (non-hydrolysing)
MNPNVSEPVHRLLGGLENVLLIEPLDYLPFIRLLDACTFVLTDSGGIQEEAPSLGKPVLVMRNTTERKEAIDAGAAALVGTSTDAIVHAASRLLTDQEALHRMAHVANPFGDGTASASIVRHIEAYFAGSK